MNNHQKDDDKSVKDFLKKLDYETLTKTLKDSEKKLLTKLGITTTEDVLNFLSMLGANFDEKIGDVKNLIDKGVNPFDLFASDGDDEEGYEDDEDVEDYDEEDDYDFYDDDFIPKGLFIEKDSPAKEYHIRIKLNDAPVKIWRELKVPSNMSLELLAQFLIIAMGWDKWKAQRNKWRTPEATLMGICALGGGIGTILGMYTFRHKTKKVNFYVCNVLTLLLWGYVIYLILNVW